MVWHWLDASIASLRAFHFFLRITSNLGIKVGLRRDAMLASNQCQDQRAKPKPYNYSIRQAQNPTSSFFSKKNNIEKHVSDVKILRRPLSILTIFTSKIFYL
jgi:hypothetical protein